MTIFSESRGTVSYVSSDLPEHCERLYPATLMPEGGQQLGGAVQFGRLEGAERSHRQILQSTGALALIDGDRPDARHR
jgi:hypothetical protein